MRTFVAFSAREGAGQRLSNCVGTFGHECMNCMHEKKRVQMTSALMKMFGTRIKRIKKQEVSLLVARTHCTLHSVLWLPSCFSATSYSL